MPKLVETQAKCTKLTWKKIEDNAYNENHFKIHMKAVYDLFVSTLMDTTCDSDDNSDKDNCLHTPQFARTVTTSVPSMDNTKKIKDRTGHQCKDYLEWQGQFV